MCIVYPTPSITDLTSVKHLKVQLMRKAHNASITMIYGEIAQLDTITVDLLPGKKGVFLKYSVYLVTSRRFNSTTTRRYNDFLALHELLLRRFPYRYLINYLSSNIIEPTSDVLCHVKFQNSSTSTAQKSHLRCQVSRDA